MQKRTEERSCIWRLKARETEHMSPVKLTPIVFEIGRRELTNRVKTSWLLATFGETGEFGGLETFSCPQEGRENRAVTEGKFRHSPR
jgi:hypothetical protein